MSQDESQFHSHADRLLQHVADTVDDALGDVLDVEHHGAVLTVILADGRQFVLNKQTPNRELWLASPVSGAWHFRHDPTGDRWVSTRGGPEVLTQVLADDLTAATGVVVAL